MAELEKPGPKPGLVLLWLCHCDQWYLSKVGWNKVCKPLCLKNLGICKMQSKNQSLLFKWIWKLLDVDNNFWFHIVSTSLEIMNSQDLISLPINKMSPICRGIHKICVKDVEPWNFFISNLKTCKMGLGDSILGQLVVQREYFKGIFS